MQSLALKLKQASAVLGVPPKDLQNLVQLGVIRPARCNRVCWFDTNLLHHQRGITALRFAEQKMYLLGHHNVSNHDETITPPYPLYDFQKQIAILRRARPYSSLITTRSDEVKISSAVVATQAGRHRARLSWSFERCL